MKKYLKKYYSIYERLKSNCPEKLTQYLSNKFFNDSNKSILNMAFRSGDQMRAFSNLGKDVTGVDRYEDALDIFAPNKVVIHG
tara:strand:- start:1587 stop:1835 length:249 start_codon:yes stop_codon:yes gene_type:complete